MTEPDGAGSAAVRVGFLGAGLIARWHAAGLRREASDRARIVAVHDPHTTRAEAFAADHRCAVAPTELDVIAAADAVYVCTWTAEHPRLVDLVAGAGRAVFCEKPLAVDVAGAEAMAATVAAAGVVNQVGLVLRRSPAFQVLRSLLDDPAVGRPMSIVFRDDQYLPVTGMYGSTWRGDASRAGGGTLLEHSIHDLDLLEWLLGPVETATCRTGHFHAIPGIEDLAVCTLGFAGGAVATLTSVWHDVLARPSLRRVEVFCERAWLCLEGDWFGPLRWVVGDAEEQVLAGDELVERARRVCDTGNEPDAAFVDAVAGGGPAFPGFDLAVRAQRVADACYRSAAERGAPVDVAQG